ncbi:programmed cell death protein 7 [Varanus komodoensis]|uniref:programmed cell death protein 7 n=1 Tax=Varanus komodoensis TaxID=61221 RepID=UPI001CF79C57|nr:programmed cell death protein 7 [Varanus komodoensis]
MSQPPPPFASRFAGPPQLRGFPATGGPPPGLFRGPPPPQAFSPPSFPPFSGGGGAGLPSPAYPPPRHPFPPPLPWPQQSLPPPEGPSPPWRPDASPLLAGGRPRLRPALGPEAAGPPDSLSRAGRDGGGEDGGVGCLAELRALVRPLRGGDPAALSRRRLERSRQKRERRWQRRQERRAAREEAAARLAEREARIDRWRARRAQEVEDRHREQELKAAADSVLSEVRKKQADTKRMAEIVRGLEKLRKLRKEAAARKGVCPPPAADEAFENEVQSLKTLIKTRTELYEAEERALRVMLEGEQEEERKREMEKKQKREKEKLLQQKREMDSKLFGDPDEFPLAHLLEPFTQYYLQAEYSVPALIQIRHEWDRYLVPADHPEGNFIPPGWVLPSPPSSDTWATAVR